MNKLLTNLAKKGIAAIDATFGIDSYGIVLRKWEEHVVRKSRPSGVLREDGINIFCHPTKVNSHAKTARDLAFKLFAANIPCSLIDISDPWDKPSGLFGLELEKIGEMATSTFFFGKQSFAMERT